MSLVPFPYDVVGAWTVRHNIELSKEAFEDLIEQFWTYGREEKEDITPAEIQTHVSFGHKLDPNGVRLIPTEYAFLAANGDAQAIEEIRKIEEWNRTREPDFTNVIQDWSQQAEDLHNGITNVTKET